MVKRREPEWDDEDEEYEDDDEEYEDEEYEISEEEYQQLMENLRQQAILEAMLLNSRKKDLSNINIEHFFAWLRYGIQYVILMSKPNIAEFMYNKKTQDYFNEECIKAFDEIFKPVVGNRPGHLLLTSKDFEALFCGAVRWMNNNTRGIPPMSIEELNHMFSISSDDKPTKKKRGKTNGKSSK